MDCCCGEDDWKGGCVDVSGDGVWRRGWVEDLTGHDGVELGESLRGGNGEADEGEDESPLLCIGHDGYEGVCVLVRLVVNLHWVYLPEEWHRAVEQDDCSVV